MVMFYRQKISASRTISSEHLNLHWS